MISSYPVTLIRASRKRRIAAFMIDHIMMSGLLVMMIFLIIGPDFMDMGLSDAFFMILKIILICMLGMVLYFSKDSIGGVSFGKWVMGIMVRDEKNPEKTPSYGRLFARNLSILIWPAELIIMIVNKDKRRLGDKMVDAGVYKKPIKASVALRVVLSVILVAVFSGGIVFFIVSGIKGSGAYKTAIHEIEGNADIIAETGGIKDYGFAPVGDINVYNGYGEAVLYITVKGNDKDVEVMVLLEKEPGKSWKVLEIHK
ncbi:MAG: RDD family protein [Flavobacteriales bacterium]